MNKILKGFLVILGGALSIGLYNWILEPLLTGSFKFIISFLVTLSESFGGRIYLEISKGLHESASVAILTVLFAMLAGIIISLELITFLYEKGMFSRNGLVSNRAKKNNFPWIWILFVFLLIFGLFFFSIQESYVNDKITYYNQAYHIVAPYVSEEDRLLFNSKFSQIKDKEDYDLLIGELKQIAISNNLVWEDYTLFY